MHSRFTPSSTIYTAAPRYNHVQYQLPVQLCTTLSLRHDTVPLITIHVNHSLHSSSPLPSQPDPSAPLNLTATNVTGSANSVTISWAPPLEPNGIILTYEVAVEDSSTPRNKREADVTVFGGSTQNVSNTTTSVIITNLSEWKRV